jgi:hypothetical protein
MFMNLGRRIKRVKQNAAFEGAMSLHLNILPSLEEDFEFPTYLRMPTGSLYNEAEVNDEITVCSDESADGVSVTTKVSESKGGGGLGDSPATGGSLQLVALVIG